MKKLGTWLGIAALALQLAWPLIAGARPASIALVPLCTIDGVTHYLEVPTGKTPLEQSSAHHGDHCPLCHLGHAAALAGNARAPLAFGAVADRPVHVVQSLASRPIFLARDARAPPSIARG